MIRRMIEDNSSLPRRLDGNDEHGSTSAAIDMNRSIHSIEEGENYYNEEGENEEEEEEEDRRRTAVDYSVVLAIPPFRGNATANGGQHTAPQKKSSQQQPQQRPPIRDYGDDDITDSSSHSASSSPGVQSNFIQQRINKHKKKGKWRLNTAMDDSNSSNDDNYDGGPAKTAAAAAVGPDINKQPVKPAINRAESMVSLLEMEPIHENEVLRNDSNDNDGDDGTSNDDDVNNITNSFKSEVSGISDDVGFELSDMDDDDDDDDGGPIPIRSRSSFLPNVDVDTERLVEGKVRAQDGSDSDTFVFASIHSTDSRTHASDAPDYDYNSEHGKHRHQEQQQQQQQQQRNNITKNEDILPPPAVAPHKQKFISPMERRRISQQRAAPKIAQDEVLQVLGLPRDKPRKVHRGIMSRDTEYRLRNFMEEDESASAPHRQGNPSFNQTDSSAFQSSSNKKGIDSPSVDSGDSSMDLAFGDSPKKRASEEDEKWERVRLERRLSRQSSMNSSTNLTANATTCVYTNGNSGRQAKRSSKAEESSWHNSFNWIKNPLRNPNNSDDEDEFKPVENSSSAKRRSSLLGKIYSRFQGPQNEADDHASSSHSVRSDDSSSSSSDDSSDDEDNTWDMNILTEGQYYLSMSMLVYVYGLLRETSLLGHTEITFDEVDVNSSQSESRMDKSHRYLANTKSAGFIIRVVMDELEKKGAFCVEKEGDMR